MNPKYYWYGIVQRMIREYPYSDTPTSREKQYLRAINEALDELQTMENGPLRLKAVEDVLIRKTKTINGVALDVNFSERTVQRWLNAFIKRVGRNVGF